MCPGPFARPSILSRSSSGIGGAETRRWCLPLDEAVEETEQGVLTPEGVSEGVRELRRS